MAQPRPNGFGGRASTIARAILGIGGTGKTGMSDLGVRVARRAILVRARLVNSEAERVTPCGAVIIEAKWLPGPDSNQRPTG
jgi:hypothetical protein